MKTIGIPFPRSIWALSFLLALPCLSADMNRSLSQPTSGLSARDLRDLGVGIPQDGSMDEMQAASANVPLEEPLDENRYIVGPGDELQVYVGKNYYIKIGPESYFNFPGFEPVLMRELTLAEAKKKIKDALGASFKKDLIYVSLRTIKTIKVAVLGEVTKPGLYTARCNMRVSELIILAEGFNRNAKVPVIEIQRPDGSRAELDLGGYFRNGDASQNPYIRMGDKIIVPRIDLTKPRIELIFGSSSFLYQLNSPKPLADIATEIFPFMPGVDLRSARLKSGKILRGAEYLQYVPENGDRIELVGKNLRVFVEGEIGKPFSYTYVPGNSIRDYMAEAGMSTSSQRVGKVRVVGENGDVKNLDISSFDVAPGDHIFVSWSGHARFKEYLLMAGSIATIILSTLYLIQATPL